MRGENLKGGERRGEADEEDGETGSNHQTESVPHLAKAVAQGTPQARHPTGFPR